VNCSFRLVRLLLILLGRVICCCGIRWSSVGGGQKHLLAERFEGRELRRLVESVEGRNVYEERLVGASRGEASEVEVVADEAARVVGDGDAVEAASAQARGERVDVEARAELCGSRRVDRRGGRLRASLVGTSERRLVVGAPLERHVHCVRREAEVDARLER